MQYTIKGEVIKTEKEFDSTVSILKNKYCSAVRYAFNRLVDRLCGKNSENTSLIISDLKEKFLPNNRYCQWALKEAQQIVSSQIALLPMYVADLSVKIQKTEKKLAEYQQGKRTPKKTSLPIVIEGLKKRILKLRALRKEYQTYIELGTIPSVVFGGKRNLRLRQKGKITNAQWKAYRNNHFYSVGQKNQKGNANTRLTHLRDNIFELTVLFPTEDKSNPRFSCQVFFPHDADLLLQWLETEEIEAYSVRYLEKNGNRYVHVSFDLSRAQEGAIFSQNHYVAGFDVNPYGIAVTVVSQQGNFLGSKWFFSPSLVDAKSNKRNWLVGNLVTDAFKWLSSYDISIIVAEELFFRQTHDTNKKFNRITHNFSKKKFLQSIATHASKANYRLVSVNPAYTSIIGRLKYKDTYGVNSHQAAALVIARRGMGFSENIPRYLANKYLHTNKKLHSWVHWKKVNYKIKNADSSSEPLRKQTQASKGKIQAEIYPEAIQFLKPLV